MTRFPEDDERYPEHGQDDEERGLKHQILVSNWCHSWQKKNVPTSPTMTFLHGGTPRFLSGNLMMLLHGMFLSGIRNQQVIGSSPMGGFS
jgi:hypothetical protein